MIFNFDIRTTVSITADNISDAVKQFHEQCPEKKPKGNYPGIKDPAILHVTCDDESIGCEISEKTGKRIYYQPGCPFGYPDCILDPMKEIAKGCICQNDLTPNKQKSCRMTGTAADCEWYDNEEK